MDNYSPTFPSYIVDQQLRNTNDDKFRTVCDETRYLMWDWMEYQEKQNISISHSVYLDMWSDTFNRVWAKRENAK